MVVLSDVSPEMASIAGARVDLFGIANVSTATIDLENINAPDGAFDVVLCREGLMFAVDKDRAAREMHRVLKQGGRLAISVWASPEQNPWLGLVFDAVSAQLGSPFPPPGIPGPFSIGDPSAVTALLEAAGFARVTVGQTSVPVQAKSFEEWWHHTPAMAGPLAMILDHLPPEGIDELADRLRVSVEPYATDGTLVLPGCAIVAHDAKALTVVLVNRDSGEARQPRVRRARHRPGPSRSTRRAGGSGVRAVERSRSCLASRRGLRGLGERKPRRIRQQRMDQHAPDPTPG